jgi:hypothetical protein
VVLFFLLLAAVSLVLPLISLARVASLRGRLDLLVGWRAAILLFDSIYP